MRAVPNHTFIESPCNRKGFASVKNDGVNRKGMTDANPAEITV